MKIIKTLMAAFAGVMVLAGVASAQTYNITANPVTGTGASGTYNVVLVLSGTNYSITSTGNANGAADKHTVDQLSFTFLGAAGLTPTSTSGAVTSGTDASGTATAGVLNASMIGQTVTYSTPSAFPTETVLAYGGNKFTATGTLNQPFNVGLFKIALQDGGQQWNKLHRHHPRIDIVASDGGGADSHRHPSVAQVPG